MAPENENSRSDAADARATDTDSDSNGAATMSESELKVPAQDEATKDSPTLRSILFQLDHVFLPPKTETNTRNPSTFARDDLLRQVSICLKTFPEADSLPEVKAGIQMIDKMRQMYHEEEVMDADVAMDHIKNLQNDVLAFHIRAQNAGLLLRRDDSEVIFESFELTPCRAATVACTGHLVRKFPNIAIALNASIVIDESFSKPFASLLSGLDIEPHPNAVLRDSADPMMVTRMITGIIGGSGGTKKETRQITKRTREEATSQSTELTLGGSHPNRNPSLYKSLMACFMAQILARALDHASHIPPYLIYCARRKIDQRIRKLEPGAETSWLSTVFDVLKRAQELQDQQWDEIQQTEKRELAEGFTIGPIDISDVKVRADISSHSLEKLNKYINFSNVDSESTRQMSKVKSLVRNLSRNPDTHFHRLSSSPSQLPALKIRPIITGGIYDLAEVEGWIATNLARWTQTNLGKQPACMKICDFFDKYRENAKHLYLGNPELESLMHLVLLELWVSCDMITTSVFTFLSEHAIPFPADITSTLLLPTRELLMRANAVEQYIINRKFRFKQDLTPFFGSCGSPNSFAVRFYDESIKPGNAFLEKGRKLRTIRKKLDEVFTDKKREQLERLETLAKEYRELMALATQPHQRQGVTNDWGHEKNNCDEDCSACESKEQADRLEISIVEHALPQDNVKVKSILFWAQAPAAFVRWTNLSMSLFFDALSAGQPAPLLPESLDEEDTEVGGTGSNNGDYSGEGEESQQDNRAKWLLASTFGSYLQHTAPTTKDSRIQLRSTKKCLLDSVKKKHVRIRDLVDHEYRPLADAVNRISIMNSRDYQYFDKESAKWTSDYTEATPKPPPNFSYARLCRIQELQPWIKQWAHTSNDVIATQGNCPLKMVLCSASSTARGFIIPVGEVHLQDIPQNPIAHHKTMIRKFSDERFSQKHLFYTIDKIKGEIVNDGSHMGKILLSLLHATTSHFLPDPLTGYTGTEQALRILRSAAMASSQALTVPEVGMLQDIARLSPMRSYIMKSVKHPKAQIVTFIPGLQPLAQHDWFATEVKQLLKLDAMRKALGSDAELPGGDTFGDAVRNEDLVTRANGRLATFRLDGFGGLIHSKFDTRYKSRGDYLTQGGCDLEKEVYATAQYILTKRPGHLPYYNTDKSQVLRRLYMVLGQEIDGLSGHPWPANLKFDPKWMHPPGKSVGRSFCHIHDVLSSENKNFSDYHIIIFISTLIFAQNPVPELIHIIRSFVNSANFRKLKPPPHELFHPLLYKRHEFKLQARDLLETEEYQGRDVSLTHAQWKAKLSKLKSSFVDVLFKEPVLNPATGDPQRWKGFIKVAKSLQATLRIRAEWCRNSELRAYLNKIVEIMHELHVEPDLVGQAYEFSNAKAKIRASVPANRQRALQLFEGAPPGLDDLAPSTFQLDTAVNSPASSQDLSGDTSAQWNELLSELDKKIQRRSRGVEQLYVAGFRKSHDALKKMEGVIASPSKTYRLPEDWKAELVDYRSACRDTVESIERAIFGVLMFSNRLAETDDAPSSMALPRLDRKFLLSQLSHSNWRRITNNSWKECIISYAKATAHLQRAERMLILAEAGNLLELKREIDNPGHTNWDAADHPEWLLLEVESNLLIRPVQTTIANEMAVERSPTGNTVLQLNMGEGKSFVIIPIVAAHLADGDKLVRVIVPKEQSVQTRQILKSKLGGLLNRRVEYLPISRAIKMTAEKANFIADRLTSCAEQGSVLLVQPEELLSLRLMTIEMSQQNFDNGTDGNRARNILSGIEDYMHSSARDIIDESDQVLRPSYELVYTMGAAVPVELSPDRWVCHQEVLAALAEEAEAQSEGASQKICVFYKGQSSFPSVRLLDDKQGGWFIGNVARKAIQNGLTNFTLPTEPYLRSKGIFELIEKENLNSDDVDEIISMDPDFFHPGMKKLLALLRGLIAGGLLHQVLLKRYRIDYGLDYSRRPETRLAVPYKAKDQPKPRSQFGHPDMIILLTCLSYYQCGLTNQQMAETFNRLTELDDQDVEFARWTKSSKIAPEFRKLSAINIHDMTLCRDKIYPALRFCKPMIDFFLARIVFPQEMREFPKKISASAWDLAESKMNITTGFSGTCDSRFQLPLEIQHKDLTEQEHTNALVIDYLLRSENRVVQLKPDGPSSKHVSSLALLRAIVENQESIQVLLDVGVVISDLANFEVAKAWLDIMSSSTNESLERKEACIFYSDDHDAMVLDLSGKVELLSRSPYSNQTDRCLAYFDELHTRGIDLRLPDRYRAATTLGPGLTKDRLVQACMRMRKLGKGQSISFFVTPEVQSLIKSTKSSRKATEISIPDTICWTITETWKEMYRNVGSWQQQGVAHQRHRVIWKRMSTAGQYLSQEADRYTQSELRSLESRYMPREGLKVRDILKKELEDPLLAGRKRQLEEIKHRITQINVRDVTASLEDIDEEQERELDKQNEIEREVDEPEELEAKKGHIHSGLRSLIDDGTYDISPPAFLPAFETLKTTTVGEKFDYTQFGGVLVVTTDFATTVELPAESGSEMYHRSVRYVLTTTTNDPAIIVISNFEANELWDDISHSKHVHLHLYTARLSEEFRAMDRLTGYTTRPLPDGWRVPSHILQQLNLFAGQLFFASIEEYRSMCRYLGLACTSEQLDIKGVSSDGFGGKVLYPECSFDTSPLPLLRVLLSNVRMDSLSIRHTHMGRMLFGEILEEKDFKEEDSLFV
ncbi:hypothetical protein PspLS_11577 [Pyricularia sp. CBS 133598]|nr:hypothetical protein PspLS_11577 [Pyricularia sp. CBS 133598]